MELLRPFIDRILIGNCIEVLRQVPTGSIDLVVTDPPYLVDYRARDGRTVANDTLAADILRPAFSEITRVLKWGRYAVSFYGWNRVEVFVDAWSRAGLRRVGYESIRAIQPGERIRLASHLETQVIRVNDVRRYQSFDEMIKREDASLIAPGMTSTEVLELLKRIYPPERERLGVVVLDIARE